MAALAPREEEFGGWVMRCGGGARCRLLWVKPASGVLMLLQLWRVSLGKSATGAACLSSERRVSALGRQLRDAAVCTALLAW
jgi:hypothetical protein